MRNLVTLTERFAVGKTRFARKTITSSGTGKLNFFRSSVAYFLADALTVVLSVTALAKSGPISMTMTATGKTFILYTNVDNTVESVAMHVDPSENVSTRNAVGKRKLKGFCPLHWRFSPQGSWELHPYCGGWQQHENSCTTWWVFKSPGLTRLIICLWLSREDNFICLSKPTLFGTLCWPESKSMT